MTETKEHWLATCPLSFDNTTFSFIIVYLNHGF